MQLKKIFTHKFLLNCCNFVFMICGGILLFAGFYLFSDTQRILLSRIVASTNEQLNDLSQPLFYYIAFGLAFAGTIAILSSVIGFWASCLNTYCFLSLYFCIVVILLLAESAVCLAITIWPQCLGLNLNETKMVKILQGNYGIPGKEQFTIAMDLAQTKFNCCGMNSDINYDTSLWRLQGYGQRDWTVPLTCCKLYNQYEKFSYLDPKPINGTICQTLQKFNFEKARHTESCLDKIDLWYREQYVIFLGISLIIAIIEFCVLLSIILNCTKIAKKKSQKNIHNNNCKQFETMETRCYNSKNNPIILNENIYETDFCNIPTTTSAAATTTTTSLPNIIPTEIKEIYIQPQEYHKNKHNTTFKPSSSSSSSKNRYHISNSYLV